MSCDELGEQVFESHQEIEDSEFEKMVKRKGLSADEKRERVLKIFHERKEVSSRNIRFPQFDEDYRRP